MRTRTDQLIASTGAGFAAVLCLAAAGGLVGLSVRGGLPIADASGPKVIASGAGPMLAMLGFFPLLLFVRFDRPRRVAISGAAWGSGVAIIAAGIDPAVWLAYIAGPALFGLIGSWLTRRIGFQAILIAVLWLLAELAMIASGLAPRGMLAALAEGSAICSGVAAWLGSVHVALLLALVTAGVMEAIQNVSRRRRFEQLKRAPLIISILRDWRDLVIRSLHRPDTSRPRGPPVARAA